MPILECNNLTKTYAGVTALGQASILPSIPAVSLACSAPTAAAKQRSLN